MAVKGLIKNEKAQGRAAPSPFYVNPPRIDPARGQMPEQPDCGRVIVHAWS